MKYDGNGSGRHTADAPRPRLWLRLKTLPATLFKNLDELTAIGEELGGMLGQKCVQALGIEPGKVQSLRQGRHRR